MHPTKKPPRPSYPLILFVSWLAPMLFLAFDTLFVRHGLHHATRSILQPNDLRPFGALGVMNAMFCLPVSLGLMLVVGFSVRLLDPPLSRAVHCLLVRLHMRDGLTHTVTSSAATRGLDVRVPSLALPMGAFFGAVWSFGHITGYMAMSLYSSSKIFVASLVLSGAVCGLLIGLRRVSDLYDEGPARSAPRPPRHVDPSPVGTRAL